MNLASQEYWHAIGRVRRPPARACISVDFREEGPEGLRFNSFAAKRARGMMARYMHASIGWATWTALKGFDSDGYRYDPAGSTDEAWRFVRS